MILFFDTETTGFPHKSKPLDHPDQPHIVQLAAELCEGDGKTVASFSFIIDPGVAHGVRIPSGAAAIHGIDEERAWRYGIPARYALRSFNELYQRAEVMVGHNVDFDCEMVAMGVARERLPFDADMNGHPRFCTMKSSTDICKLQSTRSVTTGAGGYKWPKLAEAYKHFTGLDMDGAHDAMNDLRACKAVYFELKKMGVA